MKVYLKYGFIFDPSSIWATQEAFEQDMAAFFKSKGLRPELIESAPGQEPIPIVSLTKEQPVVTSAPIKFSVKDLNKNV